MVLTNNFDNEDNNNEDESASSRSEVLYVTLVDHVNFVRVRLLLCFASGSPSSDLFCEGSASLGLACTLCIRFLGIDMK